MLEKFLDNLQIRYKLLLLIIFPFAVLMLFTGYGVFQKWQQHGEARVAQYLHESARTYSKVIHAIQNERGLSAGYLGSAGEQFKTELIEQRVATDRHIKHALSPNADATVFDEKHRRLIDNISSVTDSLNHRYTLRNSVDVNKDDAIFERYSTIITNIINLVENINIIAGDATISRSNQAYGILLWLQEFAGRERGLVNGLLSSGQFDSRLFSLIITNIAEQDSLIKRFQNVVASARQKAALEITLRDPATMRVREMRQILLSVAEKLDALEQLQTITGYGGLIHQFKNYVLRGNAAYKNNFNHIYTKAQHSFDTYRNIPNISNREKSDISIIEKTFQKYYELLPVIEKMRNEGSDIDLVDNAVKVDDTMAIDAITRLRKGVIELDPAEWFHSATAYINLLNANSDAIRWDNLSYIKRKTQKSLISLASYILLATVVSLLCLYLGAAITRRLALGTLEISQALKRVEESGDFSGHIQVYGTDEIAAMGRSFNSLIEGRHAAEDRLNLAYKVFDSTIDGILITDPEQKIILINRATSTITGYTEAEILGRSPYMLTSNRHNQAFFRSMWQDIAEQGSWRGEVWNRHKNGDIYPLWQNISEVRDEQGQVVNYISIFSDISAIKQTQAELEHLAHHDPLTSLPNRLLLDQHLSQGLERAHRNGQLMAVLFLDLDRFKNINDSLGHQVGDVLLQLASQRLKRLIRAEDLIARLGGDEFAIVLEAPTDVLGIGIVAQKCLDAFAEPFKINDNEVYAGTSIGISIYPNDGTNTDELVKYADTAMYAAKERSRNTFQFYDRHMTELAIKRLTLENELRAAIENNEFILHYQPQVNLNNGLIIGAEALIRWQKPAGKIICPDTFIPVAEESGLIEHIDAWVLQNACSEIAKWLSKGVFPSSMAINISGFSIEHGLLIEMAKKALYKHDIPPSCLELEITEGYLMKHKDKAAQVIEELQGLGVMFSIDDFGTGYSSLSYMKSLPINKLKIDRSFIKDIQHNANDKAIATSVIALGHSMQMEVIAEGVEVQEQVEILSALNCDSAQGFFYSKPVTGDEFMALLIEQQNG
ncbi:diguanylate cyclase/phosphodiesterase (GGDEF & EAL domains) with PAS/PAC sensor(s) [hydrothermal vent metagenome]|uniref:Diguanylate cyclase/phosphodiesterase (GGDEF & EAL domains) with PAS/PAC sensor(S) n=1 Tax=hydrothermal vent metagenome TaxID=652676 RepID=A0A3B1B509_9ZZZZ